MLLVKKMKKNFNGQFTLNFVFSEIPVYTNKKPRKKFQGSVFYAAFLTGSILISFCLAILIMSNLSSSLIT
jgi:hypothetical protein